MKTYYIESLGCAKNLVDSEVFAYHLEAAGYTPAPIAEEADIVLINSCAFLQSALAEFDEILTAYAEMKNLGQIKTLIVSGCVMNRALDDFKDLFPEVDSWIGLKDFDSFKEFLGSTNIVTLDRRPVEGGYYAYLRISDGCVNNCSYCTIPSIRGTLQSVVMDLLVSEARQLADRGAKELILIAQDTCLYGIDLYGRKSLPDLVTKLLEIDKFHWIRLLYLHPDHFEIEWLEMFKSDSRLLPYFEIPIQHSEDSILKAMNRNKGKSELIELFNIIRRTIPNAILRTTLISGFPGETYYDHKAMCKFIEDIPFYHLGVFCYSAEPGTIAYMMPKQVSQKTAMKRQDELLSLHREQLEERLSLLVGECIEVLVEAEMDLDDESCTQNQYLGRAWFQAPDIDGVVYISADNLKIGSFVSVQIDDVIDVDLFGTVNLEK